METERVRLAGVCGRGYGDVRRGGNTRLDARRSDVHLRLQLGILLRLLLLLHGDGGREIDGALDDSILMDDQARRNDVAGNLRGVAKLDALGGVNLAIDAAADDDLARGDLGLGIAFLAHGQAAFVQLDFAGDATFDDQVFRGGDVAGDGDVLSDKAAFGSGHAVSPVVSCPE